MPAAVFEALMDDGSIGILRVYDSENTVAPAPYKLFTVVKIKNRIAKLYGLMQCDINWPDIKAMAKALKGLGVSRVEWIHDGKDHFYTIK